MRFFIVLVVFLSGCATTAPVEQVAQEADHPRFIELNKQLAEGRITNTENARGKLELAQRLYPEDAEFHALRAYGVVIAAQLDRGEITPEMRQYLWAERTAKYYQAREERNMRLRQQYGSGSGSGITASDLLMLDMINRPFNRMRAPTSCQTRNVAGVEYMDCY